MTKPKILVIGDAMTDVYHCGTADHLSAEVPIPVVKITHTITQPGGAGNVTMNLRSLGADVEMVSGRGQIEKHRLMVGDHQIARWDMNDQLSPIPTATLNLGDYDAIVVANYNKGSISQSVINKLAYQSLPVFVDTKVSPLLYGFDSIFFPNTSEYTTHAIAYADINTVVVKQGPKGMTLQRHATNDVHVDGVATAVRSVCGAGDTTIAAFTYWYCVNGGDLEDCLRFANAAAGCVVEKPYTSTTTVVEVLAKLRSTQ